MYKKVLKFFLMLTNLLIALLAIYLMIAQDNNSKIVQRANLDNNFTQIGLPRYPTSNAEYEKLVQAFKDTSKELSIPVIKKTAYQGADNKRFINFEVSNLSTSLLSQNFNRHFQSGKTYSTKKSINAIPLKKYGNTDFTVKTLTTKGNHEGFFYIETLLNSDVKAFQKLLCKNINAYMHTHYQPKDFNAYTLPTDQDLWTRDYSWIRTALISLVIFQVFFYLVYILSFARESGIFKLTGHSSLFAFKTLILPELSIGFLIPLFSLLIYLPFSNRANIFIPTIELLAAFFISEAILSFILIFLSQKISIKKLLQGFSSSKGIFYALFISKGALLVYIVLNFLPIAQAELSFMSTQASNYVYQNYANIFPSYIGYNPETFTNDNINYRVRLNNLYPTFDNDGAIYIDTSSLVGDNSKLKLRDANINSNYLQHFPLKDSKNNKVTIKASNTSSYIILLPEKYQKYQNEIVNEARINYQSIYRSHMSPDQKYDFNVKFIYIKNNQPIYDEKGHKIYNYTHIYVVTPDNYQINTPDFGLGKSSDSLKIPLINNSVKQTYQKYYSLLKKYNMIDNFPNFIRSSNYQKEELKSNFEEIKYNIIPEVISLALYLIISISVIYLYFSIYGKNFAIKYTLGISKWHATWNYWLLWGLAVLIMILFCIYRHIPLTTPINATLFITVAVVDFLISIISIHFFSKSTLWRFLHD